ncbi:hypothetical protein QCA50_000040 [Cerrena zonata]|uniref:Uncharacterized protein n=1 Tax=Cerrena zonata TaxID=2478898 RepID=A0AAW0GVV7_9APHY
MAMFQERLVRSGLLAAGVALCAHGLTWVLPDTLYVFTTLQSSVAILALASLAVLVVTHHRREGGLLTQTQEEAILVGAFGLAWFAILVGIRAYKRLDMDPSPAAYTHGTQRGGGSRAKSYPCDSDSLYCIDEEWTWY